MSPLPHAWDEAHKMSGIKMYEIGPVGPMLHEEGSVDTEAQQMKHRSDDATQFIQVRLIYQFAFTFLAFIHIS